MQKSTESRQRFFLPKHQETDPMNHYIPLVAVVVVASAPNVTGGNSLLLVVHREDFIFCVKCIAAQSFNGGHHPNEWLNWFQKPSFILKI